MPRTKPKNLTREEKKQEKHEALLKAARKEFAEKGYNRARVSGIVKRAGVAQGTFYLYFNSKRDVFGELLDEFGREILASFFIPGAEEIKTSEQVRQRLLDVALGATRMLESNRDLARVFLVEGEAREPGFERKVASVYKLLTQGAAANLKLWMDRGLLRKADPLVIANCVVGMIERLVLQHFAGELPGDFESMVEEAVRFELYGIFEKPFAKE